MTVPPALRALPLLLVVLACGRGPEDDGSAAAASVEDTVARDRVAAMVYRDEWDAARRVLAPLVERRDVALGDLLTAVVVELDDGRPDAATPLLERASAVASDSAAVHYLRGRSAEMLGNMEDAARQYRRALTLAPDDLGARYALSKVLVDLETGEDEALRLCGEIERVGLEIGGPWYFSAIYELFQLHVMIGEDPEAARRYQGIHDQLRKLGMKGLVPKQLNEGTLAPIVPPAAIGNRPEAAVRVPHYSEVEILLPELGGGAEVLALDLNGDRLPDIVSAGENGIHVALRAEGTEWRAPIALTTEPARLVRAIDLHKDKQDTLDLVYLSGTALRLLECEGILGEERWTETPLELPSFPSPPADLELVDFDHDGDLDLFLVGDFGGRLLRDDGAGILRDAEGNPLPRGTFTDASVEAGLPTQGRWRWCAVEDLESDQDVDLLMGGPGELWVGSSLRAGRFEDVARTVFGDADLAREPLLADFDGDARPDALVPGQPATLYVQQPDGSLLPRPTSHAIPVAARPIEVDLDLDGTIDVLWPAAGAAAAGVFALALPPETAGRLADHGGDGPMAVVDLEWSFDDQLAWEILRLEDDGVHVFRATAPVGNGMRIQFHGRKDNRQGVGAVVELRSGGLYRRHFWRGRSTLYGLGEREYFDVLRVTWPNGVVQHHLDVAKGNQILDSGPGLGLQPDRLGGSCPFLYAWNGATYGFVTDVLGITPLGLPMAPGVLVPPDHDEYVLVRGDQLVPRDGELVLQFTEELREVTYLDRIRLDVVDHPAGYEVQPNERFCFPPFPEPHTHVMRPLLAPLRALGSDGRDWTDALATVDDVHAVPFEPIEDRQFQGLAEPHWLELEFDRAAIAGATRLRLVCTGWFFWTDASVNVAAARTPGVAFVPPTLELHGEGGWAPAGPPLGFPAGKSKSMVLDVTELLSREDPRLRISSTLRLYWDSIRLVLGGDGPQRTTALEPRSAKLWPRGFSAPEESGRADLPERFDWQRLAEHPRWNQHPGRYTRFGETLPLVTAVDDRFVIMGAGDALTVTFDATSLPPVPEGWERDYLVFLDGWAKDRDPNTVQALAVEPLPFHGMSGYPYGSGERFPDDPEHRAWRAEWNTREAFQYVAPLSPERLREWLAVE